MVAVRAIVATLAVLVAAWFAVGVRQVRNTDRADTAISETKQIGAHDAARVTAWLNAAGQLNPGQEVDVLRGRLALLQNEPARAERILLGVTHSEPLNLEGWVYLAQAALHRDPTVLHEAVSALARLHPRLG